MCEEWKHDFEKFCEWSIRNGYQDGLTIDRIDANGDYCPENCRWVTQKEQCNNRTNNSLVTFNGKTQTLHQWADEKGIKYGTLWYRINKAHWSIEDALSTP